MQIKDNNKDLGNLKLAISKKFKVELFNDSDETIEITNVSPSCGSCTVAHVEQIKIVPHGTTKLVCTFTPNSTGFASKKVNIYYKQGEINTSTTFSFNAQVTE